MDVFWGIVWRLINPMSDVVMFVRGLLLTAAYTQVAQDLEAVQSVDFAKLTPMMAVRTCLTSYMRSNEALKLSDSSHC